MKRLFLMLACCQGVVLSAASSEEEKKGFLSLTDVSIAYFQQCLADEYVPIIEEEGFSKETGLTSIFWQMYKETAQKVCADPTKQEHAARLWNAVEKDPTYQDLATKLAVTVHSSLPEAIDIAKQMIVQARKDIQITMSQQRCVVYFPPGNLNKLLSLARDKPGTIALFGINKEFPAQDERQNMLVQACSIAQCYSTQTIVGEFLPEHRQEALATMLKGVMSKK